MNGCVGEILVSGGWVKGMVEVACLFTLAIRGLNLLLKSRHPKLTVDIKAVTKSGLVRRPNYLTVYIA